MRLLESNRFRYAPLLESFVVLLMGWALNGAIFADEHEHYLKSVKPVLQSRCFACHGALKQEANLRLDTVASMLRGGDDGQAIHSGDASTSLIVKRISAHEDSTRMPPEGEPLLAPQIEAIKKWLNEGAIAPADEKPERDPREHWAFAAPVRPELPQNAATNPIDAFLADKHLEKGLVPQQDAEPAIWLRRVSLDLVGLPPSSDELKNFELDHSIQAQRLVVERLLNSPHYGERWGRHWMDIWRYSDWWGLGEEVRNSQKHMWHWRDWIVESLNTDQGYDQMLQDMLAADELHPNDLGRLRASGFLARQYFKFNRTSWLDETIEHTSKAMMGLTFNCCKCHDHKYDPISQEDYYRLRAVFEPYQIRQDMTPGGIDFQKDAIPRAFDCNLELPTYVHTRGDDRNPNTSRSMEPAVPEILRWEPFSIQPVSLPKEAYEPGLRSFVEEAYRRDAESNLMVAQKKISETKEQLDKAQEVPASDSETETDVNARKLAIDVATAEFVIAEKSAEKWKVELEAIPMRFAADRAKHEESAVEAIAPLVKAAAQSDLNLAFAKAEEAVARAELESLKAKPETKVATEKKVADARTALELAKKQIDAPGEVYLSMRGAEKSAESNLEGEESRKKAFPKISTGRRSALARWLIDRRNPLTARVAVNHIWSRHFGRPIVATVFDFGRKGAAPTNQKLLDWLAVELMDNQWSLKHIHRLILSSDAYRRTSSNRGAAPKNLEIDPENQFLWRMNATRMESQMVRDSLLSLAGELDLKMGGPPHPASDEKSRRRSLYFFHSHNEHNKLLSAFDDANVLDCYRRGESIVPQQALALENSGLAMEMVEHIAKKLTVENPMAADIDFARTAFVRLLASEPSKSELEWMEASMQKIRSLSENVSSDSAAKQARLGLVRGLVNHNDFITIR